MIITGFEKFDVLVEKRDKLLDEYGEQFIQYNVKTGNGNTRKFEFTIREAVLVDHGYSPFEYDHLEDIWEDIHDNEEGVEALKELVANIKKAIDIGHWTVERM